jgi:hypothetical protein
MPISPMRLFYIADIYAVFWTIVIVAAVLLWRCFRGVPTALVLIGAMALLVESLIMSFMSHNPRLNEIIETYPTTFNVVHDLMARYICFCFPVGLLWFALRVRRT